MGVAVTALILPKSPGYAGFIELVRGDPGVVPDGGLASTHDALAGSMSRALTRRSVQ
jgi:hypothetical protein